MDEEARGGSVVPTSVFVWMGLEASRCPWINSPHLRVSGERGRERKQSSLTVVLWYVLLDKPNCRRGNERIGMLLTVAFLVNRGSWTRSWLPVTARAARFWPRQLISFSVRAAKSILTMAPVNPVNPTSRRGWAHLLPRAPSTMAPCQCSSACPLSIRLDATPFPQMEGGWREQQSASS